MRLLRALGGALGAAIGSSRCPSRSHPLCFPSPAWFRQPAFTGCAGSSGGELCGEASPWVAVGRAMRLGELLTPQPEPGPGWRGALEKLGGLGGGPSRGTWAFLPPLHSPGQQMTLAFLPFAAHNTRHCGASKREQLLILTAPQPAAARRSMAAESEWSCPICQDNQDDVAYTSPCLHQFCLGCAVRWAQQKPNCPLCRSGTTAILFSVWSDDDYLTFDMPGPAEPPAEDTQQEQGAAGPVPGAQVDSFPPEVWADFFKRHPDNIRPLLPWLRRELRVLAEDQWWEMAAAEGTIVAHLCLYGLDEEALVRQLQNCLPEDAETFIHQLITAAVRLCGREIRWHLDQQNSHAAGEEDDGPAASPSPTASQGGALALHPASSSSPAGPDGEEEAGTSEAALRGGPGRPPPVPILAEQEQPPEEPGQAPAAGPSAQGCTRSPSAPGWGRDRVSRGPRRPPKRRAPSPQGSAQPRKRPPRRRR